jgi:prepilin-type N-terminal cleavage/methylation domain-containing protein
MKKAFTLIEIIITVSIIVLLTLVAIPNIQGYKQKADYQSKQDEIEALVNDLQAMSKNAEQGYTKYGLTISSNKVALYKTDQVGSSQEMGSAVPAVNQVFVAQNGIFEIYCNVPGDKCYKRTKNDTVRMGNEIDSTTQFLQIIDNNFTPAKITKFYITVNPIRVIISHEE